VKKLVLAALAAVLAASAARAQDAAPDAPAWKWGSVELGAGPYRPNIDAQFGGSAHPFRDNFGGSPAPMFRILVGKSIFDRFGTLEVGFKTGFYRKSGHALDQGIPPQPTIDQTTFNVIPTSLTLTYRLDNIYERWKVPLVPYGRVALERYNWYVTKGSKWTQHGATNGWSASVGLGLVLDWIDPGAARDLGNETGVAHTMLYGDLTKAKIDDFGSKKSWDLSPSQKLFWSGGLLVVF
jgi:hypothetical protein